VNGQRTCVEQDKNGGECGAKATCEGTGIRRASTCQGGSCQPGSFQACTAPANGRATCSGSTCGFECNDGYMKSGSSCVRTCTAGTGSAAGCSAGQFCDTSANPPKCSQQVRNGQPCQSCATQPPAIACHQGNKRGVIGECENGGFCVAAGVKGPRDYCCDPRTDLCEPPGEPCCAFENGVAKCLGDEVENRSCASFKCNQRTGLCE
jgi:hypothetical protein